MGLLGASLLAAIQRDPERAYATFTITGSAAGPYDFSRTYSDHDVASEAVGPIAGKIVEWGRIRRVVSDDRGGLVAPEASVVVDDTDRSLETLFAGGAGRFIRGSSATITLRHHDVAAGDTVFVGRVGDYQREGLRYRFSMRLDTAWLDQPLNTKLITVADWTNVHASALNKLAPVRYGTFDSTRVGAGGSQVCPYVDTVGFRYMWTRAFRKTGGLDRVYENGVLTGASYALTNVSINGYNYSLIDFATDRGTAVITADGLGLEANGDGTGTLIDNPATILHHYVENFVLRGDYRSGAYSTGFWSNTLSGALATFAGAQGLIACRSFEDAQPVRDAIAEFLNAYGFRGWHQAIGLVAMGQWDHQTGTETPGDVYPATRITEDHDVGDSFRATRGDRVYNSITAEWHPVQGGAGEYWEASDYRSVGEPDDVLDLSKWSTGGGTADADARTPRYAVSRRLNEFREQVMTIEQTCPLEFIDVDLLSDVLVSNPRAPSFGAATGPGWGRKDWQGRLARVTGVDLDLGRRTVTLTMQDIRPYICSLWELNWQRRPIAAWREGEAILDRGTATTRAFSRASSAWINDPGQRLVLALGTNTRKISDRGMVIERATDSYLKQNAGSITGWTLAGTVALEATSHPTIPAYWRESVVANAVKFTGAAASMHRTTIGIPSQRWRLWGVARTVGALHWSLQATSGANDTKWWNEAAASWDASSVNNVVDVNDANRPRFWKSTKVIEGSATGITYDLWIKNVSSATLWTYLVQVDTNIWAGSPIPTTTAEITRALDASTINNDSGKRVWPNTRGTFFCDIASYWDSSLGGLLKHAVFHVVYDASNWWRLYYDMNDQRLKFERRAAGTTTTAVLPWTFIDRQDYSVAVRWCSSDGELGLAPYTESIFARAAGAQWQKGTDAVGAALPTETASSNMRLGDFSGPSDEWDGVVGRGMRIVPLVLTDEEISQWHGDPKSWLAWTV